MRVKRLCDIVVRSQFEAHHLVNRLTARSQQQNRGGKAGAANLRAEIKPAAEGKHDVEDDQIEGRLDGLRQSFMTVHCEIHNVAFAAQPVPQRHAQFLFVFHDENALVHGRDDSAGGEAVAPGCEPSPFAICRCRVNVLPAESSLRTDSLPPMDSAILLARDSPKPVP